MVIANAKIREWSERFRQAPLASRVVASLHRRSAEIWRQTFELLQRESPEYRNSVDGEFTKESKAHCKELLTTIVSVAAGQRETSDDPFRFVRTHAEWRARHQVPLTASLHAYRLAHKTYWVMSRESLLRHPDREEALLSLTVLSDFLIEFFDCAGAVLAETHAAEEAARVAQNTPAYVSLIESLLQGIEPVDAEKLRLRNLCGIRLGAPMAVAVARSLPSRNGREIDRDANLRSLVRLIEQVLPSAVFGKMGYMRNGEVVVIVCSDAGVSRGLMKVLRQQGIGKRSPGGLAAGVGVSLDTTEIARLPEALEEARMALDFTTEAQPVTHFSDIDMQQFLIRRADTSVLRLIPEQTRQLTTASDGQSCDLARTIRVFADCSLNVKQTARQLGVHANTVYFRLNRIGKLTGVEPRTFHGTVLLLTTLRLLDAHGGGKDGV